VSPRLSLVAAFALALCACPSISVPGLSNVSSFKVEIGGFYLLPSDGSMRTPLEVVTPCSKMYGGQDKVPAMAKGTKACPYVIPHGDLEIDVTATALDAQGKQAGDFGNPVAFRVVPGDLVPDYKFRWAQAVSGVATSKVRSRHQYGQVRIWAEDAPPQAIYDSGVQIPGAPDEPKKRSYATGLSPIVFFEEPTIAKLQLPDGFDNRSSPLVGEFITIGKRPESGETLVQSCADDKVRDGLPALMVVTGTDPSGFYVSDLSACRSREADAGNVSGISVNEPPEPCVVLDSNQNEIVFDGGTPPPGQTPYCQVSKKACSAGCNSYQPGTFGGLFVYNYSFPDGLDQGDLLFTLSGAVQEFTSTTQLTFPSWSIAERVRQLPPDQWNKWLQYARPVTLNQRICGGDNKPPPVFLTDQLCGHNRRNLKMESLESALVRLSRIRFPTLFKNCDLNADNSVPFFCEQKDPQGTWIWGSCAFGETESPADQAERECNQNCVVGVGIGDEVCTEAATFQGFGQFVVTLAAPGMEAAGLDESLANHFQDLKVGGTSMQPPSPYSAGARLNVACDGYVRIKFGDGTVQAGDGDAIVQPHDVVVHTLTGTETTVALKAMSGETRCTVSQDLGLRANLITKDAIPELKPACSEDDPDYGMECKKLHAATFDVIGHLKQVQPGRPRWSVYPRDVSDVCCHPGGGFLDCPRPIKPCP